MNKYPKTIILVYVFTVQLLATILPLLDPSGCPYSSEVGVIPIERPLDSQDCPAVVICASESQASGLPSVPEAPRHRSRLMASWERRRKAQLDAQAEDGDGLASSAPALGLTYETRRVPPPVEDGKGRTPRGGLRREVRSRAGRSPGGGRICFSEEPAWVKEIPAKTEVEEEDV